MKGSIVGEKQFKSKKELTEYTRKLIEELGECQITKEHPKFKFFLELLLRRKTLDEEILYFEIELNPITRTPNHLSYTSNTKTYFSWVKCCEQREDTPLQKLVKACRTSVKSQINSMWIMKIMGCNECKSLHNLQVDHYYDFKDIFNSFIKSRILPESFEKHHATCEVIFKKEDKIFEEEFQKYHSEQALLQFLCEECHKKKSHLK
jgi:hypothetical protein